MPARGAGGGLTGALGEPPSFTQVQVGTKDLAQVRTFYYRTIKSINKALEEAAGRSSLQKGLEELLVKNSGNNAPGEDSHDSHQIMVGWWKAREKEGYTGDGALAKLARKPMKRKRFNDTVLKLVQKVRRHRERAKQKAAQKAAQAGEPHGAGRAGSAPGGASKRNGVKRAGGAMPGGGGRGGFRGGASVGPSRGGMRPAAWEGNGKAEILSSSLEFPEKFVIQLLPREKQMGSALRARGHNPQLELTLSHKKSMASILRHLTKKWRLPEGEQLVLSVPAYKVQYLQHLPAPKKYWQMRQLELMGQLENFERLEKLQWGLKDAEVTAAMVFAFLVAPSPFQLDYYVVDSHEEAGGDTASCLEQPSSRGGDRSQMDMPVRSIKPALSGGVSAWLQGVSVPGDSLIDPGDFPMDSSIPVDDPFNSKGCDTPRSRPAPGSMGHPPALEKSIKPLTKRLAEEETLNGRAKSRRKNTEISPTKSMKGMGELPETSLGIPSPLTFNTLDLGVLDKSLEGEPIMGIESRLDNDASSRGAAAPRLGKTLTGGNPMERFFLHDQPHLPSGAPKYGPSTHNMMEPPSGNRLSKLMGDPEGMQHGPSALHYLGPQQTHGQHPGGVGMPPVFSTEPFPRLGAPKVEKAPKRIRPTRLGPATGGQGIRPEPVNVPGSVVAQAAQQNGHPLRF